MLREASPLLAVDRVRAHIAAGRCACEIRNPKGTCCLGDVIAAVRAKGGACIVTADHGNCDHMLEPDGSPNTAHSLNPVPLIVTADGVALRDHGILADVAPTALELLGLPQPQALSGHSLLAHKT